MRSLLLPLCLLLAGCPRREAPVRLFDRVSFDAVEPAGDAERRVLEVLRKKEHWLDGFRVVGEKVGPFPDGLAVRVGFDWPGDEYAHGGSNGEKGWVRFNLRRLGEYQEKVDALEKQRREEEAKGRLLGFRVPPARIDRVIWHELTHVLQRGLDAPDWFKEGMAVWVSDDPNCLAAFAAAGQKAGPLDAALSGKNGTYARGHLFWKWLDSKGLARKVAAEAVVGGKGWRESLVEATGLEWGTLAAQEQEWSAGVLGDMIK